MTDNYDQLALSWVRKEINNTLDQARQGLENFAEDTQDQTQIQFCINCLHQVQGTLQMLEFSGAARLAQEMEILAEKMASDPKFATESSFEVLMRALLQMPGYLERVEEGQKDVPIILLPLLNELRGASGLAAIAEQELFTADAYQVLPPKAQETVTEKDKTTAFQDNAKKLRAHFQKGLTGIIRGQAVKESLSRIHKVLLRLEALTEGHSVARLWWVADGFIFSIAEGGLYKKKEAHQLLAQVDKQIRRLSEEGAEALDDVIPEKLLSQLLYFVARSSSKNSRVQSLKKEFNLESKLVDSQEIKERQEKLTRPDSTAVTNVVGAINEELANVKDQLDLFVRAQAKDSSALQSLVDSLVRISDTLTLLELAIPRDVIRQQIRSIQTLLDQNKMPSDAVVMDIAGALLFVEANLKNVNLEMASDSADESESSERSQAQAKESQVDEATQALIKVARKSMQSAKDKMINYIASGFEREALADVPVLLEEVLGAVRIVQFDNAANILKVAKDFIEQKIIGVAIQPKEEYLDALADVITSVEYFLEASEEGQHRGVNSILKGAQKSMDSLEASLLEPTPTADIVETPVTETEVAEDSVIESVEEVVEETPALEINVEPAKESADIIPIVASADKQVDETLIDEEVLEIFLEEAEEEIQTIDEMLPRWVNNIGDEEALTTIRRSFHTLKGSGRLVGARVIGEVAWSIENMLNRVIEESIPAESPVTSTLNEAFSMLPALVDAFSKQTEPNGEHLKLIAKAEHIAAGKPLAEFSFDDGTGAADEAAPAQSDEAEVASKEEAIDPVLLEIFTAEADGHLQSIRDFIATAPAEGSIAVTDELIRALHTLKGSAHMAGVEPIASLTGPWEKHSRLVKGSNQRLEQPAVILLKETHEFLISTLEQLQNGQPFDTQRLAELQAGVTALDISGAAASGTSVKQRDQQMVSIFLTEGLDILQEVAKLNGELAQDNNNVGLKNAIKNELHAFHQGAKVLAIDELEALASSAENLSSFGAEREDLGDEYVSLMANATDALMAILNRIASEEDIDSPQALVSEISQWMEKASSTAVPEDMDVELVELFVEEGEELIESARELLVRWKDNLHSKELHAELRRIYHTLKGSSRMAGAMNIGDLGYAAEDMFNTVLDFGREISTQDYDIIQSTTDKLESMIAVLKTLRWPGEAAQEVYVIRQFLSPDETLTPPVIAEPTVLPVEESLTPEVEEVVVEEAVTEEVELGETAADEIVPEVDEFSLDEPVDFDTVDEEIPTIVESVDEEEITLEPQEEEHIPTLEDAEINDSVFGDALVLETEDSDFGEMAEKVEEAAVEDEIVADAELELPEQDELQEDALEFGEEEISLLPVDDEDEAIASVEDETPEDIIEEELVAEIVEEQTDEISNEEFAVEEAVVDEPIEDEIVEIVAEETVAEESDSEIQLEAESETVVEEELLVEAEEPAYVSDTISPAAPIEVTGNIHKVELDEDGEEVLDIYLEEADELLVSLDEALHEWSDSLDNKQAIDLLQRTLHTFKGGARLSDLVVLGDLTHEMETYFEKVNAGQLEAKPEHVDFLLQGYDVIESLVNEVKNSRQMTVPTQYMTVLDALIKGESPAPTADTAEPVTEEVAAEDSQQQAVAQVVSFEKKKQQQEEAQQKMVQTSEVVRVTSEQLEDLVNLAGETSIFRSRLEQQMSVLRYNLEEMSSTVDRLRDQLRNLDIETDAQISYRREVSGGLEYEDFDPLEMDRYTRQQELTRGLSESAVDLLSLKETLDMLTADSETLLLQQGRVNTEMQESLMRTRMIPFESLVPRLRRMVRQISTELGKTIELSISADGEMDRTVLERMVAPLEHMLRNAMDHGIESPDERKANQKSETGSVKISMFREGNEVFIKLQDDGRGLNLHAIRKKAIEKGLITEKSELSDHELQQLILEAGFSTAEQVTQISGRGVGMDVVSSEIKQLGGVIEIDSHQGIGTTFTVKLPFTMSVNQALMVQLGDDVYAIPLSNIEGIVRVSPFELEEYYGNPDSPFEYAGIDYSMYYLGQLLDHQASASLQGVTQPLPVLLLHGADHPTALQVDDLLGSREIVVKSIGSQLSSISGLSGATILGDGRVVLILDMPALIRRIDATSVTTDEQEVEVIEDRVPRIMVVDDSITVRKVTTRLLERHDFEVITAKDGVDALSVLGEQKPDVMLLDIEMPRMDGFELATIIRHDEVLKDLPIIMITSRTGEKHRERAEQIGVNQYMGKPYNEVDLLESISALLPNKS